MNKLLVTILCIVVCSFCVSAGGKVYTFSGNITHFDDEYHNIVADNGKKEMLFFVVGSIICGDSRINLRDLSEGCAVTVTYQKSKNRLVANKVEVRESMAMNHEQ